MSEYKTPLPRLETTTRTPPALIILWVWIGAALGFAYPTDLPLLVFVPAAAMLPIAVHSFIIPALRRAEVLMTIKRKPKTLNRSAALTFEGTAEGVIFESTTRTGGTGAVMTWIIRDGERRAAVCAQLRDLAIEGSDDLAAVWSVGVEPVKTGDNIGRAMNEWCATLSGNEYGATLTLHVPAGTSVEFIGG